MGSSPRSDAFEYAQNHPRQLVAGLFAGFMSTLLTFGVLWFFAPILPLVLWGITRKFRRTKAFSVGVLAAFAGIIAFVGLFAILILVLSLVIQPTPPPSTDYSYG
ncbi:hypothetical protein [Mycobacterium simiae]|uniref:Uncharacterized protein n=1 Tax=Mycobacterium simiae TaxID=1784 RepID=A0A1X0YHY1_MYCSI|nr:hypothetical protein [Mycobacterium simiae]ORJ64814.1 hypothetical protein B5M45_00685 [Mycobacterium simiae]